MAKDSAVRRWLPLVVGLVLLSAVVATNIYRQPVGATHKPADKVAVSGSVIEILRTSSTEPAAVKHLLSGTLRTSTPSDLIFSLTAECALWTTTANQASQDSEDVNVSETEASVRMLITVDFPDPAEGATLESLTPYSVPVTLDANGDGMPGDRDDGDVVFCDRAHRMDMQWIDGSDSDDNDDNDTLIINSYLRTRAANGFNWLQLNLGNGIHQIDVWGVLLARVVQDSDGITVNHPDVGAPAAAAVGKRTLLVTPAKLANDATY